MMNKNLIEDKNNLIIDCYTKLKYEYIFLERELCVISKMVIEWEDVIQEIVYENNNL